MAATLQKLSRLSAAAAAEKDGAASTPLGDWSNAQLRAVQLPFSASGASWAALKRSSIAAFRAVRWLSLLLASAVLSRPQE